MPSPEWFVGSDTSSALQSYYAVLLHELTHWSGATHRLSREFGQRFGDQAYAMEELVAELGAAFLCSLLGIANEPRPDHASYIGSWLDILGRDNRAIFTAAKPGSVRDRVSHAPCLRCRRKPIDRHPIASSGSPDPGRELFTTAAGRGVRTHDKLGGREGDAVSPSGSHQSNNLWRAISYFSAWLARVAPDLYSKLLRHNALNQPNPPTLINALSLYQSSEAALGSSVEGGGSVPLSGCCISCDRRSTTCGELGKAHALTISF